MLGGGGPSLLFEARPTRSLPCPSLYYSILPCTKGGGAPSRLSSPREKHTQHKQALPRWPMHSKARKQSAVLFLLSSSYIVFATSDNSTPLTFQRNCPGAFSTTNAPPRQMPCPCPCPSPSPSHLGPRTSGEGGSPLGKKAPRTPPFPSLPILGHRAWSGAFARNCLPCSSCVPTLGFPFCPPFSFPFWPVLQYCTGAFNVLPRRGGLVSALGPPLHVLPPVPHRVLVKRSTRTTLALSTVPLNKSTRPARPAERGRASFQLRYVFRVQTPCIFIKRYYCVVVVVVVLNCSLHSAAAAPIF